METRSIALIAGGLMVGFMSWLVVWFADEVSADRALALLFFWLVFGGVLAFKNETEEAKRRRRIHDYFENADHFDERGH